MEEDEDEALLGRIQDGDEEAFRLLYERYRNLVYTLGLRVCGSASDAEDVLQKTFLRVFRGLPGYRGESKFSTWIYRVALRVALNERKGNRRRGENWEEGSLDPEAPCAGPSAPMELSEAAQALQRHLAALEPRDRALLHLRYQAGKSYEEIAAMMGMPLGTVKTLLFRAKAALRRRMEGESHGM